MKPQGTSGRHTKLFWENDAERRDYKRRDAHTIHQIYRRIEGYCSARLLKTDADSISNLAKRSLENPNDMTLEIRRRASRRPH
jgi:hypothetical protein